MKKKTTKILIIGMFALLLISLTSANLILNFGKIISEAEVQGLVFYPNNESPIGNDYLGLDLNEYSDSEEIINFTGGNPIWFVSQQLGVDSFYKANYNFKIQAESTANISKNETGQIDAELWFIEGDPIYKKKEFICFASSSEAVNEKDIYSFSCPAEEFNDLEEDDRIALILSDGANSITYSVYLGENTKVEVEAK